MSGNPKAPRFAAQMARVKRLRAERDAAQLAFRKHCQVCAACHLGIILSRDACDEGWQLAMARARANNAWNKRDAITAPGNAPRQGTLW